MLVVSKISFNVVPTLSAQGYVDAFKMEAQIELQDVDGDSSADDDESLIVSVGEKTNFTIEQIQHIVDIVNKRLLVTSSLLDELLLVNLVGVAYSGLAS